MRSKLLLAIIAVLMALPFIAASAQDGDPLNPDTVRIVCQQTPTVPAVGDSVSVQVYVYNDEELGAFSLGFHYNNDFLQFSSWKEEAAIPAGGIHQQTLKDADNQILLGWITFNPFGRITANPGGYRLLATMYFKVLTGATVDRVEVDSIFVPPAGSFVLSKGAGGNVFPQFRGCSIGLPVYEFDGPILPENYALSQNQPNPFNPSTTIDFALPRAAKTRIDIYNILGQKVVTLVDEYLSAGNKRVEWNGKDATGNDVASGIYLYRMTANDYTETKKMMLMK